MTYPYTTAPAHVFEQLDRAIAANLDISAIAYLQGRASAAGRAALRITKGLVGGTNSVPTPTEADTAAMLADAAVFSINSIRYEDGNKPINVPDSEATEWELQTDEEEPTTLATYDNRAEAEFMAAMLNGDPIVLTKMHIDELTQSIDLYRATIRKVVTVIQHPAVAKAIDDVIDDDAGVWQMTKQNAIAIAAGAV